MDEAYFVVEEGYRFRVGDRVVAAGPGDFVHLPREVPHRYLASDAGEELLMLFVPGGTEDYLRTWAETGGSTDEAFLAELSVRFGIELLGTYADPGKLDPR